MDNITRKELYLRLKWNKILCNQDYFTDAQINQFRADLKSLKIYKVSKSKSRIVRNKKCNQVTFKIINYT